MGNASLNAVPEWASKLAAWLGRRWGTVLLVAWLALTGIGAWSHEPFRDEAQRWLLARDASWGELLRLAPYDAAPVLWPVLLRPLVRMGAPYWTMGLLNWLAVAAAGVLLWRRAPLPGSVKAAALYSYYLIYDFPAIARHYSLSILFLFGSLALWPRRLERPLVVFLTLALLANTNVFGTASATCLGILLAWDLARSGRLRWSAASGVTVGAAVALAAWQVTYRGDRNLAEVSVTSLARKMIEFFPWTGILGIAGEMTLLAAVVLLLALLGLGLLRRPRAFLLYAATAGPPALLLGKSHLFSRYLGYLVVAALAGGWLAGLEEEDRIKWWPGGTSGSGIFRKAWVLALWLSLGVLGVSAVMGLHELSREWRYDYTGARKIARQIREHNPRGLPLAVFPDAWGCSVVPYLEEGTGVYYLGTRRYGTYLIADDPLVFSLYAEEWQLFLSMIQRFPDGEPFLFLCASWTQNPLNLVHPSVYRLLARQERSEALHDEYYSLYECRLPFMSELVGDGGQVH